ncbi:YbaB/EbfC family nucleoid-associated protein [Amycolatopsis sp. cg5]|uniref:YbaB/EbfC family nucleoid-associated protein n=1 Tax=Amycolatopsis sp. cg5 TaxID=3238802 RepID=UPI0035247D7C
MTPEEWLANFDAKIADVQAKAAEFQENLEASSASEANKDGSIRVTVAPNGSLTDLHLADSAVQGKSGSKIAEEILKLARKAQRSAAVNVAEAFKPMGADSEAMHMVTGYIPPEEPEEPEPAGQPPERQLFAHEEPEQPRQAPPTPPPPPARQRRPRPDDEDDDFGGGSILRRD